jgi:hypothetical protein
MASNDYSNRHDLSFREVVILNETSNASTPVILNEASIASDIRHPDDGSIAT